MPRIRPARAEDADRISAVHEAAVEELAASHYDDDQIEAWGGFDDPERRVREEWDHAVVAETAGTVVGFGALVEAPAEVRAVYVHPDHGRRGVGTAILARLEAAARERGLAEVSLYASLNAVPFYEARGYERVADRTIETGAGRELPAVEMRKRID